MAQKIFRKVLDIFTSEIYYVIHEIIQFNYLLEESDVGFAVQ